MSAVLKQDEPRVGVFLDEPVEVYHERRLDVAHASGLSKLDNDEDGCPARYFHYITQAEEDEDATKDKDFGSAFHMAFLEPDRFASVYSVMPSNAPKDMRRFRDAKKPSDETKRCIDWWDNFAAKNAGKVFLSANDYDASLGMAESVRRLPLEFDGGKLRILTAELLDLCETEVTVRYIDEETGIECAIRADLWSEELAFGADLKSARSASRAGFSRAINARRYHVAHAHYCEAFRRIGKPLRSFPLLVAEKVKPYCAAAWHIDSVSEERGWALRQRAMRRLRHCLDTGEWPSYTTTIESIGIPAYGHYDLEESK